jgi:putative ABC transport system ATP-binding protein
MTVETRQPGETIVREGVEGDRFYVIGSGIADSFKAETFDQELCFGEGFGMISSYFKRPIPSTVTARTEMELYVLSQDDFLKALAADTGFESRIRRILMEGHPRLGTMPVGS